ncbi:MAG: MarR family transcriptional regulator [Pseudonocardiaceae bacterium]
MRTAEELRYLILAIQREGNRVLAADLRPLGLTPSQAEVLRVLADFQPLTLTGLGELLVCEHGTNPSRLVDRLVSAGLVWRETQADDESRCHPPPTASASPAGSSTPKISFTAPSTPSPRTNQSSKPSSSCARWLPRSPSPRR